MPEAIQPQVMPFSWQLGMARTDQGETAVVLVLHTVSGTVQLFSSPASAAQLGNDVVNAARQAATGLVVPNGALAPSLGTQMWAETDKGDLHP